MRQSESITRPPPQLTKLITIITTSDQLIAPGESGPLFVTSVSPLSPSNDKVQPLPPRCPQTLLTGVNLRNNRL
ncbi:hypothetical protein J6590_015180 [Homalodisca vitripennis]|nr:hypothetical protein J6590_015180 [Homalodisca vitripennis]